ncbi:MAG: hypothetical protein CMK32_00340 [Porticoccaceae bacterium]|nr:hypothetical protein [Porticoccaceae bacterium]
MSRWAPAESQELIPSAIKQRTLIINRIFVIEPANHSPIMAIRAPAIGNHPFVEFLLVNHVFEFLSGGHICIITAEIWFILSGG